MKSFEARIMLLGNCGSSVDKIVNPHRQVFRTCLTRIKPSPTSKWDIV